MRQLVLTEAVQQTLKRWKNETTITREGKSRHTTISIVGWLVGLIEEESVQVWHVVQNSPFTSQSDGDLLDQVVLKDVGFFTSALPGPHIQLLGPVYITSGNIKSDTATQILSTSLEKISLVFHLEIVSLCDLERESFYFKDPLLNLWKTFDPTTLLEPSMERDWYCFCTQWKLPCLLLGSRHDYICSTSDWQGLWETFERRMEFLVGTNCDVKLLCECRDSECELLAKSFGWSPTRLQDMTDIRIVEKCMQFVSIYCCYSGVSQETGIQGVTVAYEEQDNSEMVPFSFQVCCLLHSQDRLDKLIQSLKIQLYNQFSYLFYVLKELPLEWKVFKPSCLLFPVIGLLPYHNQNENESHKEIRKRHHEAFQVDHMFPYFRLAVSLFLWKEKRLRNETHLLDVHKNLSKGKSFIHGIQRLVKGSYQYFHYMQVGIEMHCNGYYCGEYC